MLKIDDSKGRFTKSKCVGKSLYRDPLPAGREKGRFWWPSHREQM